uniref:Putative secreted protein n=1 Tax=Ixodes ricinus TaxID=34613 RepID=A0A6B0U6C8_IXORI
MQFQWNVWLCIPVKILCLYCEPFEKWSGYYEMYRIIFILKLSLGEAPCIRLHHATSYQCNKGALKIFLELQVSSCLPLTCFSRAFLCNEARWCFVCLMFI